MAANNAKPATTADETEHATTAENLKMDIADEDEQEAAEDIMDDPFAMMSGMGEEDMFDVTLMKPSTAAIAPTTNRWSEEDDNDGRFGQWSVSPQPPCPDELVVESIAAATASNVSEAITAT